MKHFGPSGLPWSNTCSCGGNVFWVGGCSIIIWSRFQQLHRGWETEKKYFLQSDGEFYKGVTWTYGPVKDFGCNDPFDDRKTQISCFCKGKILVRHQCLVIYDLCFTILWFHVFVAGYPWVRFWFAIKFYSSDPNHLREEITRYLSASNNLEDSCPPFENQVFGILLVAIITTRIPHWITAYEWGICCNKKSKTPPPPPPHSVGTRFSCLLQG